MGRKFLIGVLLLLCSAPLAHAQTVSLEPVRLGDPDVMRTLREVYPDLGADGKAMHFKGVRVLRTLSTAMPTSRVRSTSICARHRKRA